MTTKTSRLLFVLPALWCGLALGVAAATEPAPPVSRVLGEVGPERNIMLRGTLRNETWFIEVVSRLTRKVIVDEAQPNVYREPGVQVWLLKADGTTIAPTIPATKNRPNLFGFPPSAATEAVALALKFGESYHMVWLSDGPAP